MTGHAVLFSVESLVELVVTLRPLLPTPPRPAPSPVCLLPPSSVRVEPVGRAPFPYRGSDGRSRTRSKILTDLLRLRHLVLTRV